MTEFDYKAFYKHYGYSADAIGRRGADWWLRSPGLSGLNPCIVELGNTGWDYKCGVYNDYNGVRPAMYVEW